ncbi:MAG: hypothetical protein ACTS6A_01300, partial [Candidatus Hodgkinia cicadicola]
MRALAANFRRERARASVLAEVVQNRPELIEGNSLAGFEGRRLRPTIFGLFGNCRYRTQLVERRQLVCSARGSGR